MEGTGDVVTTWVKWPHEDSGVYVTLEEARLLELDRVMYGNAYVEVYEGNGRGRRISPEEIASGRAHIIDEDALAIPWFSFQPDDAGGDAEP